MNIYTGLTVVCWLAFLAYWRLKAGDVKTNAYAQSSAHRAMYLFFLLLSFALLYAPILAIGPLGYQLVPEDAMWRIAGVAVAVLGVSFAIWARKTLGENWSGNVTLKEGHELIKAGPYSIVRHPIYTGFEICFLGAAITVGQLKGFAGLVIIFFNHLGKIKLEEEIMRKQFAGQYEEYSKRVKRLIPFIY